MIFQTKVSISDTLKFYFVIVKKITMLINFTLIKHKNIVRLIVNKTIRYLYFKKKNILFKKFTPQKMFRQKIS